MDDQTSERSGYQGPAFFSYGFRPFFLGAALFAGVAIPAWISVLSWAGDSEVLSPRGSGMCMRWSSAFCPL